ncbi:MAG: polymer-forming cytoskeletal protein [Chitinophagaceae bacterium]|nr:polymer-forming cytoskeletal protein [Chitinophagaceae bacterium]MBN8667438.1 polymer-forming cytoskeletal protein [Chitinophagales bacterium]
MFNAKSRETMSTEKTNGTGSGTTLIGSGTTLKGDISSNSDLRIDGMIIGNIRSSAKIVIGASGVVEGDIEGNQADIVGKVSGNIKVKDILQLRGDCVVSGNLYATKLQVEPTATFNGQCHMGNATNQSTHSLIKEEEPESELAK